MIDQRELPGALVEVPHASAAEVAYSIRGMVIRGAPAIGQVAAIGLAMTADRIRETRPYARRATLRGASNALVQSRPTAVNLRWAVDRLMARYEAIGDLSEDGDAIADAMRAEADAIVLEATTDHGRLATFGLEALPGAPEDVVRILTHCNTGPLACGQFGTALGVVQAAHHAGRAVHVWVDETRPYLQGARLTAWELAQAGVPHTLLPDVAAGHLMANGEVDVILVGADRVAANGDTANKIGTYQLAVLAARHGIPFYVCAPTSSVDLDTPDGSAIPIEERKADEVLLIRGIRIAPPDTAVRNPGVRRDPGRVDHRDHHGGGDRPAAVRGRPPRRPGRRDRAMGAPARTRPAASARRSRPRPKSDGDRRAGSPRRRHRADHDGPGGPARVPRARPAVRRLRDLRPRGTRVRPDPLGGRLCRRASRSAWSSSTTARRRSRCSSWAARTASTRSCGTSCGRVPPTSRCVPTSWRPSRPTTASTPARRWSGCGSTGPDFRPYPASVSRILPVDIGDLNRLYQLGFASWLPSSSLAEGVYYGVRVNGSLVAAAGTHVVSPSARLAVVGNVFTHIDYRGRGFATAVTGAVTAELLRSCDQVVLNVRSDNPPALNAYRRLGFTEHVRFEERLVHRLGSPWPDLAAPLRRLFTRKETDPR